MDNDEKTNPEDNPPEETLTGGSSSQDTPGSNTDTEAETSSSSNTDSDTSSGSSATTNTDADDLDSEESVAQDTPEDALSRTPEELENDIEEAAAKSENIDEEPVKIKKTSALKLFLKKVNIYFLVFMILIVIAAAITIVNYLNSQKVAPPADIATQQLDEDALRQLANNDATVGSSSQTLTIQGNAIISGQTLARGDLNVASNLQTGGSIQGPSITISGSANIGEAQINSLQVAANTAIQGSTTLSDLSVTGASTFNGAITASQITVTSLILSGNATLEVPNHIRFSGPTPNRTVNSAALGGGGSVSVSGSDTAGTVNINTGNNPTAGCYTRVEFRQAFSNQPHVIISPVGAAAGRTQYYVDRNTTGFSICASSPAPNNQPLVFDYFVTN